MWHSWDDKKKAIIFYTKAVNKYKAIVSYNATNDRLKKQIIINISF